MENVSTAVLVERMDNILETMKNNHTENKEAHQGIMERQDHTNGNVTALQKWKAYLIGAWAVVSLTYPLIGYLYFENMKHEMKEIAQEEVVSVLQKNFDGDVIIK